MIDEILPKDCIYALDIGTRNVVGVVGKMEDEGFIVMDHEVIPHPERAMFDGQIHDINRVVKIVKKLTETLEERNGIKLKEVAIAAAGRALKTRTVEIEKSIDYSKNIDKALLDAIEMEGIQKAQDILDEESNIETRYYCVGYTATNYYLEGHIIKNPLEHRGSNLKIDIVATFLPHVVVDSLYTVIDKAGLEVINLTLEPIAAINVAIPEKLRLLNLALVDVGAGTSDIALTKQGSIISYGMVSKAGDSLTEAIVEEYLLDFDEAEEVKKSLMLKDNIKFVDIVGVEHKKTKEELLEVLDERLESLTDLISKEILEKNSKKPSAVFCIGGGCQVPGFTDKLADKLDIPKERAAIKGAEFIKNVSFLSEPLEGPKYITPLGIGYNGILNSGKDFLQVFVNGKKLRLFNSKKLSVSHALILVGFDAKKLLAQRGEKIYVTVNGEKKVIPGEYGDSAQIYINGVIANLDAKIKNKDQIHIEEGRPGEKRKLNIYDYIDNKKKVFINKKEINLIDSILVNGGIPNSNYIIKDGDNITYNRIETLEELAKKESLDLSLNYFVLNGKKIEKEYKLKNNDSIEMHEIIQKKESIVSEKTSDLEDIKSNKVSNISDARKEKNEIKLDKEENSIIEEYKKMNSKNLDKTENNEKKEDKKEKKLSKKYLFTVNNEKIVVNEEKDMVFVDIFEHIDFDLKKAKGILDLRLNGERAKYTDVLKSGDNIEIKWR